MRHWAEPYIGVPFVDGGRTPDGWDCYGLYRWAYWSNTGVLLPEIGAYDSALTGTADVLTREQGSGRWSEVPEGEERELDAVLIRTAHEWHVGVLVDPKSKTMLHVSPGRQTVLERFTGALWRSRIAGFWRPNP